MAGKDWSAIQGLPIQPDSAPTLRALIAEELQRERESLLLGVEELIVQHVKKQCVSPAAPAYKSVAPKALFADTTPQGHNASINSAAKDRASIQSSASAPFHVQQSLVTHQGEAAVATKVPSPCIGFPKLEVKTEVNRLTLMKEAKLQETYARHLALGVTDGLLDSFSSEKNSKGLKRIVDRGRFELLCGLLISINIVLQTVELQYAGLETGYKLGVADHASPARDVWPHAHAVLPAAELALNIWFVIELFLRIGAGRLAAFKCRWIQLDILLVSLSVLDASGLLAGFNPSMMRMLRFLRVLRMFRLLRGSEVCEPLIFFLKALSESLGAMIWTFVVLAFIQLAVGMVLHQIVGAFINDDSQNDDARRRLFAYFGTFTKTMITMFEITLANWVATCRLLMTDVSEWFGLFYIVYRGCFCFGALRVITAVFIVQVNRSMARDDDLVVMLQEKDRTEFKKKLEEMFDRLDTSRDGFLSWAEFKGMTESPLWRSWGAKLGLPLSDMESLYELLAGDDGRVSAKEFFAGVSRLKGNAKSVDMVWLLSEVGKLIQDQTDMMAAGAIAGPGLNFAPSAEAEEPFPSPSTSKAALSRVEI